MGDVRFDHAYRRLKDAVSSSEAVARMTDEDVVAALAAAASRADPYLLNVLATEAMNRFGRKNAILGTAAEGLLAVDGDGVVTFLNPTAERLLGWTMSREGGRPGPALLVHGGRPVPLHESPMFASVREGRTVRETDVEMVAADGRRFVADVTAAPILREGLRRGAVLVFADATERRRAAEATRVSEARFRALFEQSPLATQIFAPDGRVVAANEAWERLWGVPRAVLAGYNILEDRSRAALAHADAIRTAFRGEPSFLPATRYDPSENGFPGAARWVETHIYPIREDGAVREVVLVLHDVTAAKTAEERLAVERARLERLLAAQSDLGEGMVTTEGGRITWANPAAERLLGFGVDEMLALPSFVALAHADDREALAERVRRRVAGQPLPDHFEARFVAKDGRVVVLEIAARQEPDRPPGHVVALLRDVTEARRATAATEVERARLAAVLEALPVGVIIADSTGRLVATNAEARRIWGAEPPLVESIADYGRYRARWAATGEPLAAEDWALARALREGQASGREEIEVEGFDGVRRRVWNWAVPVRDSEGRVIGAVAVNVEAG